MTVRDTVKTQRIVLSDYARSQALHVALARLTELADYAFGQALVGLTWDDVNWQAVFEINSAEAYPALEAKIMGIGVITLPDIALRVCHYKEE